MLFYESEPLFACESFFLLPNLTFTSFFSLFSEKAKNAEFPSAKEEGRKDIKVRPITLPLLFKHNRWMISASL